MFLNSWIDLRVTYKVRGHVHFPSVEKLLNFILHIGFPDSSVDQESTCNAGDPVSIPGLGRSIRERMWGIWVGKIPQRRERLLTPVFWPGEFHGLHSPWCLKESDTTKQLSLKSSSRKTKVNFATEYQVKSMLVLL